MSRAGPLVYVSPPARKQGEALLGSDVVLEKAIVDSIMQGRVTGWGAGVIYGDSWRARFFRDAGRLRRKPRAWQITSFEEGERDVDD